jgi:hypothetical protein
MQAYHQYGMSSLQKLQKWMHSSRSASDKVYQLLAHGRWFSPSTPPSSTTNTGRHDMVEILLKVALSTKKSINQSIFYSFVYCSVHSERHLTTFIISCIVVPIQKDIGSFKLFRLL